MIETERENKIIRCPECKRILLVASPSAKGLVYVFCRTKTCRRQVKIILEPREP